MKKRKNILFILIIMFFSDPLYCQPLYNHPVIHTTNLYHIIQKKLKNNDFKEVITIINNIKNKDIMYYYNDKIQINLIYAYYKNSDFDIAQEKIEIFKILHPQHKNIDYILYLQSLIYIALDNDVYFKYIPITHNKRDPIYAIKAFFQLKNIILNYPHSRYLIDAKKHLICLKNRLAMHEFNILKYYFSEKEYISVINRGEAIIKNYQDTLIARKTLLLLEQSYRALHYFNHAQKISQIINLNKIF
ncbi:outer membrane protein assembly factor BamD [Buchnera aphidicola]|uniref:outer membrane protein assembly factor BamD n=1 Tax=Buchnera aphidicola TaxID=9 RepID=UPI003463F3F1